MSYDILFERHPDAVFVMDAEGYIAYANLTAYGLLDGTQPTAGRTHYLQTLRSDELEMFHYYFQEAVERGEARSFEMEIGNGSRGRFKEVRARLVPHFTEGRTTGVTVYLTLGDAREYEPRMGTALDAIGASFIESHSDPILVLSQNATIALANASFSKLLGWRKDQLEGFHILKCPSIPPYLVPQMKDFVTRVFAGGGDDEATMETIRMTDQGREFQMLLTLTPVRDRVGLVRYWAVHLRDITKRKFLEEQLKRIELEQAVEQELRELEHLKTVSQLAASISHEVRNPLTVTRGFMQILKDSTLNEEKRRQYFDLSLEELDRAERIITDYLTFAKPALEHYERLELNTELRHIVQVILPFASMENIAVELDPSEEELYVYGEGKKLHQALINVMKNGIEATPAGGSLTIRLKRIDGNSVLTIEDSGQGMDEEQLKKLGTPYYTTKDKGTGLGTMVAFSIFKAMEGEIKVESKLGRGTRFVLSFPTLP
ncbi:PAS domain-containing sensor histidine kinase [Paenibacillus silviterrae]|uniref:PAS domain-containing sensor histidine kinase n=1 Tax=Paenibacillus silviterrae TaxID=3242194 RepID=UPI002542FB5E|nr:PAS domain-containing sensor histidine kinase [Paenibacillus chinjuensis]